MFHFSVVAVAVAVELAEYQIPYLNITVAVAANVAVRLAAALFRTTVEVDLRTRAARTGTVFPEVVLSAQTNHVVFCHTDLLRPHVIGLVIVFKDGYIQLICRHLQHLGEELPGPCDCLDLEVIAEREVSQHLEECAVAGCLTDIFDIAGTDTFLACGDSAPRWDLLACEVRL